MLERTDTNISQSQQTDFGLLESMLDKPPITDKDIALKETVAQTPPLGLSEVTCRDDLLDASIRTEQTIFAQKEEGKLCEEKEPPHRRIEQTPYIEKQSNGANYRIEQPLPPTFVSIQSTPAKPLPEQPKVHVNKKEEFLMRMEVENQMKRIKEMQRLKKQREDQEMKRRK